MTETITRKPKVYTVSELNYSIKKTLETSYENIWVEGEISNYYYHNSRHMYFDLKDEHSKIKVVMFYQNNKKLLFDINDGLHILAQGYISLYEKRGEYQVIATDIKPVGKGSLILAFEQLKEKLEKAGYFSSETKKSVPRLPKKIGLATSTGGAVIRDIISVLNRRSDNYHLVVRNVNVQGASSSEDVCQAIDDLADFGAEVIILARGGGSLEDLWGFNTPALAEKIYNCPVPVISAIGHETDFTISDFVSDLRAATPSVAAELVILNKYQAMEDINRYRLKLRNIMTSRLRYGRKELFFLISRKAFKQPLSILASYWQVIDDLNIRLKKGTVNIFKVKREKTVLLSKLLGKDRISGRIKGGLQVLAGLNSEISHRVKKIVDRKKGKTELLLKALQATSPVAILGRGYGIVYKGEKDTPVKSIKDVSRGESIKILIKDGIIISKIVDKLQRSWGKVNE